MSKLCLHYVSLKAETITSTVAVRLRKMTLPEDFILDGINPLTSCSAQRSLLTGQREREAAHLSPSHRKGGFLK